MAIFGDLLRLARNLRGFTQNQASAELRIAQAVLSRLENGLIAPEPEFIGAASSVYRVPRDFFEVTDTVFGPPVSVHTMLRGKKSEISARDVDMITAELNLRLMHLRRFLENVDFKPINDMPELDIEQYESPQKIASAVRTHWRVNNGPIKNLTRLAENAGVIVGLSAFHGAAVSGVTFAAPGRQPIVLLNNSHPADRLRFTLAHELGHLVMHRFPTPKMEDEANQFASALLLPPNEIKQVFRGRRITLELLAALKPEWRVSMAALLMSARSSGAISPNQERYLWQQISSRGWRLREPVSLDFMIEQPTVLPSIINAHLEELGFSISELARLSRISETDFLEFYGPLRDQQPTRPRLRIVN